LAIADTLERWKNQVLLDDFARKQQTTAQKAVQPASPYPYFWMAWAMIASCAALAAAFFLYRHLKQRQQLREAQDWIAQREQSLLERQQRLNLELQRKEADAQIIAQAKIRAFLQDLQQQLQEETSIRKMLGNLQVAVGQYLQDSEMVAPKLQERPSEAGERLLARLQEVAPQLTQRDLLICSYIHAGIVSREIAALLHINTASVEKIRNRLRKKLPIPEEQSLNEYFLELLEEKAPR
jgi:DNA-binding CsgD family transcriptional regulator